MKLIKKIALFCVVFFMGLLEWMNVTPGHIRRDHCCGITYSQERNSFGCPVQCPHELSHKVNRLLITTISKLDFYK